MFVRCVCVAFLEHRVDTPCQDRETEPRFNAPTPRGGFEGGYGGGRGGYEGGRGGYGGGRGGYEGGRGGYGGGPGAMGGGGGSGGGRQIFVSNVSFVLQSCLYELTNRSSHTTSDGKISKTSSAQVARLCEPMST